MSKHRSSSKRKLHDRIVTAIENLIPIRNETIIEFEGVLAELLTYNDKKSVQYYLTRVCNEKLTNDWASFSATFNREGAFAAKRIYEYAEHYTDYETRSTYILLFSLVVSQCDEIELLVLLSKINEINDGTWQGSVTSHSMALNAIANGFYRLGFAHEAYQYALRSVALVRNSDDIAAKAVSTHTLAIVAYEAGDFEEAEVWYYEALDYAVLSGNEQRVALIKLNISKLLYFYKQEYEKAIELIHSALHSFEERNEESLAQDCLIELGQVYTYLGQKENAFECTLRGVQIAEKLGNNRTLIYSLTNLSFIYAAFKDYKEALPHLFRSLEILQNHPKPGYEKKVYYLLYQIHYELGDFEKAYNFLLHHTEITTMLRDEAVTKSANRHKALYEVEKAHYENQLLRIKSEKLEQEIDLKTKELTTLALQIAQKNELLNMLLHNLDKSPNELNTHIHDIRSQIVSNMNTERSWEQFEKQFKLVHFDFIERLSRSYPSLSPGELKVCALMRINLSSKEMSSLLCQSERSIETYRYRIRKKFNLTPDKNLVSFLSRL